MKVAIIGAGASGITCAIALKQQNKSISVTVYERMPRALKKILATGNGRCNLTNVRSSAKYFRGDIGITEKAFLKYPPEENMKFFNEMGLLLREESEGRVYPVSGQASSVVNVLLSKAQSLGVNIVTDTEIKTIKKSADGFVLNENIKADKVVVSAGGSAAKAQGTDGASFRLLKSLGLKIITPTPALTGVTAEKFPKALKGIRNICEVSLEMDGKNIYTEKGEVQFNDYGLSGIPVMQLSGIVGQSSSDRIFITLDMLPDTDERYIYEFFLRIKNEYPEKTAEEFACGLLPKALGNQLLLLCGIKKEEKLKNISKMQLGGFSKLVKCWKIKITGVRDFDFAQVTAGGLDANELDPETLSLKKYKNLYVTGEAVNICGLCGGHNLQWAWSSGRLCADAILKEI